MSSFHRKSICPKWLNIGTVLWATVCEKRLESRDTSWGGGGGQGSRHNTSWALGTFFSLFFFFLLLIYSSQLGLINPSTSTWDRDRDTRLETCLRHVFQALDSFFFTSRFFFLLMNIYRPLWRGNTTRKVRGGNEDIRSPNNKTLFHHLGSRLKTCLRCVSSPRLASFSFSSFILLTNVYLQIVYAQKKAQDTLQNDMSRASGNVFFFLFFYFILFILFTNIICR